MSEEFQFRVITEYDFKDFGENDHLIGSLNGLELKNGEMQGEYEALSLDSGINECKWHRIKLEAEIPDNAWIEINYCFSGFELNSIDWNNVKFGTIILKKGYLDSLIFPYEDIESGQYLSLNIILKRVGDAPSPVLNRVQAFYERESYLRYLPEFYQDEENRRDFYERFLSIFESSFLQKEEDIINIAKYFDPKSTPEGFLPWLASWMDLELYGLLKEKNRDFILKAIQFYNKKGTVAGLQELVYFLVNTEMKNKEIQVVIKEYQNNIMRFYGMNHYHYKSEINDDFIMQTKANYHNISTSVNTEDKSLITNIGTYKDKIHYTINCDDYGQHTRNTIGIFIIVPNDETLIVNEEELLRIINSFLPVFVKVKIKIITDFNEVYDTGFIIDEFGSELIDDTTVESYKDISGLYKDHTGNWLKSNKEFQLTNSFENIIPHDQRDVDFDL